MRYEPAHSIIEKLGGASAVARILNLSHVSVLAWRKPKEKKGTDGQIPSRHIAPLVDAARRDGIELDFADFFDKNQTSQGA
jgi:hypothetical protein